MRTHKTCKQCGITHELVMFHKKGGSINKYRSKCKICFNPTGTSFSVYTYPTAEMQKQAVLNKDRINKNIKLGLPTCFKCKAVTDRRGKLCPSCKLESLRVQRRKNDKRNNKVKRQRKRINLSGSYVRALLVNNTLRKDYGLKSTDIPPDLVDLKRKELLLIRQLKPNNPSYGKNL